MYVFSMFFAVSGAIPTGESPTGHFPTTIPNWLFPNQGISQPDDSQLSFDRKNAKLFSSKNYKYTYPIIPYYDICKSNKYITRM